MSSGWRQLQRADKLVAVGAVALLIFVFFFDWIGASSNVSSVTGLNISANFGATGWEAFTNSRWIWLITIVVALGAVALVASRRTLDSPIEPSAIVLGLGALSSLLILYRIVHHPSASATIGPVHASVGIRIGIWLGLIAALAITCGGYLQVRERTRIA
jgi:hypothetical protein